MFINYFSIFSKFNPLSYLGLFFTIMPVASSAAYPPAITALEKHGVTIIAPFSAPSGLQGYTANYNGNGVAIYLTNDGKHAIVGTLFDAAGNDLSEPELEKTIYAPMAKELWQQMEKARWIQDGKSDAKQIVYVFTDPNCTYCHQFWREARPWVDDGRVQLRHLLVGIISKDSPLKAQQILTSTDPETVFHSFGKMSNKKEFHVTNTKLRPDIKQILDNHEEIMSQLGAQATPAIYYLDPQGRLQQQLGMPDAQQMVEIFGKKP